PAVISTFVISRVGISAARRYFVTGERFEASEARGMGLIHDVVPKGQGQAKAGQIVDEILKGGPMAVRAAKRLGRGVPGLPREKAVEETVRRIAEIRISPEAQEGLSAFLEKRKPNWP